MGEGNEQWHWQEPQTAWRGIGIYHLTHNQAYGKKHQGSSAKLLAGRKEDRASLFWSAK